MLESENIVKKTTIRKFILLASLSLVGCSEGVASSSQTVDFGEADREIAIQPIQVCSNSGSRCASVNLFEDITRRILEQAKLKVSFLPTNQIRDSRFLTIDDDGSGESEFYELSRMGRAGAYGRHPDSSRTDGPINVWFVEDIETNEGFTQFGLAWVDANGVLISEEAANFNGSGRPDTLAHEIGHNLGLRHNTLGANDANNLLASGGHRNIPSSIEDIGSVSQLTDAQIAEIKRSGFLSGEGGESPGADSTNSDLHVHFEDGYTHSHAHDGLEDGYAHSHAHDDLEGAHTHSHARGTLEDRHSANLNPVETSRAIRSLANATTATVPLPARALMSSDLTESADSIPEPSSWAALPLFAILLAACKRSAAKTLSS